MIQTGNRNFWKAQIIGWSIIGIINFIVQTTSNTSTGVLWVNIISLIAVGFLLTSVYRSLIKRFEWEKWSLPQMILLALGSSILLALIFTGIGYLLFEVLITIEDYEMPFTEIVENIFVISIIMLTWNSIYFCIHYFNHWNKAEIDKYELALEVKDAQLGMLKSQLNPHFVFNALNNIRAMVNEDKDKARTMIEHFSDLLRYALSSNEHETVALEKELEVVTMYLELMQIQYEDKLQYVIQVDEEVKQIGIPPMVLQLLVENAVKHGIAKQPKGGMISISIRKIGIETIIEISNPGSLGRENGLGSKLGVGLINIRKRLSILFGPKAKLDIIERGDHVIATLNIPNL